jgi:HAD superfamily hydrolase (TIGR01509 family)
LVYNTVMMKTIVFDIAGVISPGALMGWVKAHNNDSNNMLTRFREQSYKWDLGKIDEEEFKRIISEITGVPEEEIWGQIYETSTPNFELVNLIKRLKNKYKIVLFSDNYAPYLLRQIDHQGVRELFDDILISSDYGVTKSDERFFKIMLKEINHKPDEIIFVDDTLKNIQVAEQLGIESHLFENTEEFRKYLSANGVMDSLG